MTRSKGEKRLTIGSKAVAEAIIAALLEDTQPGDPYVGPDGLRFWAERIVSQAWDVEYKPTAERLVITIDAGVSGSDKMRSTPEDQAPADPGPSSPL